MARSFNGHRSWNAWNVSLWINNDEGLYRMARQYAARYSTREDAARRMLADLTECGVKATPDGAPYCVTNIRLAMRDIL